MIKKYTQYITEFQEGNKAGLFFIENQLSKHLASNPENQSEIEHILDYLYSTGKTFKVGYKTIKEKADKWSKKLQESNSKDEEKEGIDYEVIKDWGNGFKMVKLVSEDCYRREGRNMSHCVASYYGRDTEIYSLRDKKNMPHCTIEKDSQIKGKGNGEINPKYIKYVVEFLEELGMEVRDSEMENLGYINFEKHKGECKEEDLFREKYFYKKDFGHLKNKEQLKWWNLFGLLEFDSQLNFKFKFDVCTCISSLRNAGGDESTNAGRYRSTNAGGDESTNAGGDKSINAGGNWSTNAGGHKSTNAGGNWSTNAGGDESTNAGGNWSTNAGGNWSTNAGGHVSTNVNRGKNAIAIGNFRSKCKGVIGSAFALPVYDKKAENIIDMIAVVVDGERIKENVFYCIKDKELVEWNKDIYKN